MGLSRLRTKRYQSMSTKRVTLTNGGRKTNEMENLYIYVQEVTDGYKRMALLTEMSTLESSGMVERD